MLFAEDAAKSAPINQKTYQPRLGLARVLSKKTDDLTDSKKYYNEVIDLAPDVSLLCYMILVLRVNQINV